MPDSDVMIFDDQFSLNQFSGNQSLLVQILEKFILQYQDFDISFTEHIKLENIDAAKQLVHTLKGVSGNLGMKALHQSCREFEKNVTSQITSGSIAPFLEVFKQTLATIQNYITVNSLDVAPQQDNKTQLIAALKRKEFISDSQLQSYLQSLNLSPEKLDELTQAIDDFDYPTAIALLE